MDGGKGSFPADMASDPSNSERKREREDSVDAQTLFKEARNKRAKGGEWEDPKWATSGNMYLSLSRETLKEFCKAVLVLFEGSNKLKDDERRTVLAQLANLARAMNMNNLNGDVADQVPAGPRLFSTKGGGLESDPAEWRDFVTAMEDAPSSKVQLELTHSYIDAQVRGV